MSPENGLIVFEHRSIGRVLHQGEWWFVVSDVVETLTDSANPGDYIKKMRQRDKDLSEGWGQIVTPLAVPTAGGRQKKNCANVEGLLRIIQSIPSPKAEPFKRWLAKVGYERVQEIENPELATQRTRALYKAKGYSDDWIEKRMRGIAVHEELTEEWKTRGVKEGQDFAILTAEISKATFGVTPSEHKKAKSLQRENLCDHMTDLELIFTMLGEASTSAITRSREAQGFTAAQAAAREGGNVAGLARRKLEQETGKHVLSPENVLTQPEHTKKL